MSDALFDKSVGVEMVWIFNGHRVSCRKKRDVDADLNGRYGSIYRMGKHFYGTEVEARQAHVDQCVRDLKDAERAVKVADRALSRAEQQLHRARTVQKS